MHWIRLVCILCGVRKLLLVVVAPAIDLAVLCDSEAVTEATDKFDDRLNFAFCIQRHLDFDRSAMTHLKKWSSHLAIFATSTALTESVVAHGVHFTAAVEEKHMVDSASHLLDVFKVSDFYGCLVNLQLASDLLGGSAKKADVARCWDFFLDLIQKDFSGRREHKHPVLSESDLSNFDTPAQVEICYFNEVFPVAIAHSLNLDRAQLGLRTDVQLAVGVDVSFMIPAERHVHNVWFVSTLEVLNLFRREVAVVLRWVNLVALAPDIYVCIDR